MRAPSPRGTRVVRRGNMSASDLVIVTCRDRRALGAVRATAEDWDDAYVGRVDEPTLMLAVEPRTIAVERLCARLAVLSGVVGAAVRPPDAFPS